MIATFGNTKLYALALAIIAPVMVISSPVQAQSRQSQGSKDRVYYIFERGDTLFEIASKYFRKRSDYHIVQRLNRIADPRFIPVGKKLSIPTRLLKYRSTTARVLAFRGNVSLDTAGRTVRAAKGTEVTEGARLVTAKASALTLELENGSRVSMPSNSKVRITRLRHILLTDSVDYEFAVDNGRVRSKVVPFTKQQDRYRVRTPIAVSAVRGTDYRTRVDEASGTVFSETVEGSVDVAAGDDFSSGRVVSVPSGTGAAAAVTGELVTADLLTPPELVDPAKVQSDETLAFAITPRDVATGHRIQVSTDAGFIDVVAEQAADADLITLPNLPDGRYFAKATAFDSGGFEGMPSAYSFKRVLGTIGGSAGKGDFGYRFKWSGQGNGTRLYRFQLLRGSKTALPMVDETALITDVLTMSDLPDGEYYWRVGVIQFGDDELFQKWTDFEKLTVAG